MPHARNVRRSGGYRSADRHSMRKLIDEEETCLY